MVLLRSDFSLRPQISAWILTVSSELFKLCAEVRAFILVLDEF